MSRKAFIVRTELDVQAVTCPGVWLCTNGKVSLQIYMLDSCVQTVSYKPVFPIECNENFVFCKTFYSKHRLSELQKQLHEEWIYIELIQWKSCEVGCVLATFQTTLDELLFPSSTRGSMAGVDIDLLMEPSKTFPGTIAPKVEVSTKTTVEETVCVEKKSSTSSTVVVNPKTLLSTQRKPHRTPAPPFPVFGICAIFGKTCAFHVNYEICRLQKDSSSVTYLPPGMKKRSKQRSRSPQKKWNAVRLVRTCGCGSGHAENTCPVCAKYRGYFQASSAPCSPKGKRKKETQHQVRSNLFDNTQHFCRCPNCCKTQETNDANDLEISSVRTNPSDDEVLFPKKKVCFCHQEERLSLAEKLHEKLTKTLSTLPSTTDCWCTDDEEVERCRCETCNQSVKSTTSRNFCRDLQKFYGNLYEKTRNGFTNVSCLPDCPGRA